MNKQERELEELVKKVESARSYIPPLFELYTTLFSLLVSIMLFLYPHAYSGKMTIFPQTYWAFSFFAASMLKAIGLLLNTHTLRIIGLLGSVALYLVVTTLYALSFPDIGSIVFGCMALFAMVSIPFVKYTSIR